MKKTLALLLTIALATTGCASAAGPRVQAAPASPVDRSAMAEYAQKIPAGSRIRVERTDGTSLRGTLMRATADAITMQRNTRVPEPPIDVPVAQIARLTVDTGGSMSTGKAIGIGIAAGAGALLTFFAILAATFSD